MKTPIYVTKPFLPPREEYNAFLDKIWDSGILTNMGKLHQTLEKELAEYLKVPSFMLFANGHLSLELIIEALGLTGEVITTPYTFVSTTNAIARNDLTPVFCDVKEDNFTMDPNKIEALITDKTSAIIPVHVYGHPCDVYEIHKIAKKHNLKVIYDGAHSFGTKLDDIPLSNFGDSTMYSFHGTKLFHTIEGGGVVVKDYDLKNRLHQLKNFGIAGEESIQMIGMNAKLSEFHAAMGLANLKYIDSTIEKRRLLTERYEKNFSNVQGIRMAVRQPNETYNYAYLPVIFTEEFAWDRDIIYDRLKNNNVFARKYFYPLPNETKCYTEKYKVSPTPIAERISKQVLCLPIFDELTFDEVDYICDLIISK